MILTIRNAHEEWREPVEKETHRQAAKLDKLLKRYAPDLVLLHADIKKHARKERLHIYPASSRLPSGTLHATGEGGFDVLASVKTLAFAEVIAQCRNTRALLRKDYEWKRKRPRVRVPGLISSFFEFRTTVSLHSCVLRG